MRPLEVLRNEHGLIRHFLDNLALAVERLENGERPPSEVFDKAVQFARTFADAFHHAKEEHMMFVRLAQKKNGAIDGEIQALRHQHERARDHVAAIASAVEGYDAAKPIQTGRILESAAAYIAVLRSHIHKEDHVFFPLAQEALTAEEADQLHQEFDNASQKAGGSCFEESHKLVVDMGSILAQM
jgi:hemerythrin-like domain-containing protein